MGDPEEFQLSMQVADLTRQNRFLSEENKTLHARVNDLESRLAYSESRGKAHLEKAEILQNISSPLLFAIVSRNLSLVKREIKQSGYQANLIDTLGRSVWDYVLEFGTDEILRELALWGAHHAPNENQDTAWHVAFRSNHSMFLSYLGQTKKMPTNQEQSQWRVLIENDRYQTAKTIYGELLKGLTFKRANVDSKIMPTAIILIQLTLEKLAEETQVDEQEMKGRFEARLVQTVNDWVFESSQDAADKKKKFDVTLTQIVDLIIQLRLDMLLTVIEDDYNRPDLPVAELFRYGTLFMRTISSENNWKFIQPKGCFRNRVMLLYPNLVLKVAEVIKATNAFLLSQIKIEEIDGKEEERPNLRRSQRFCEYLKQYVVQTMLSKKSIDDRTLLVEYHINLAEALFKMHDYQGVYAIISSLNDRNIKRLSKTFCGISAYAKEALVELQDSLEYRVVDNRLLQKMKILQAQKEEFVFAIAAFIDHYAQLDDALPPAMIDLMWSSLQLLPTSDEVVCKGFEDFLSVNDKGSPDQEKRVRRNYVSSLLLEPTENDLPVSCIFSPEKLENIFSPEQDYDGESALRQVNLEGIARVALSLGGFNSFGLFRPGPQKRAGSISSVTARRPSGGEFPRKRTSMALPPKVEPVPRVMPGNGHD